MYMRRSPVSVIREGIRQNLEKSISWPCMRPTRFLICFWLVCMCMTKTAGRGRISVGRRDQRKRLLKVVLHPHIQNISTQMDNNMQVSWTHLHLKEKPNTPSLRSLFTPFCTVNPTSTLPNTKRRFLRVRTTFKISKNGLTCWVNTHINSDRVLRCI